jgi:hypothetical protein
MISQPRAWGRILDLSCIQEKNGDGAPALQSAGIQSAAAI